jgi:hypothetical protein
MQTFLDLYADKEDIKKVRITKLEKIDDLQSLENYTGVKIFTIKGEIQKIYNLSLTSTNISSITKIIKNIFLNETIQYSQELRLEQFNELGFGPLEEEIIDLSIMYYNNMLPIFKSQVAIEKNKDIFMSCVLMWKAFGDYWEISYIYGLDYFNTDDQGKYFITSTDKNVALMMMWLGTYGIISKTSIHLPETFDAVNTLKDISKEISLTKGDENFIKKQMGEGMIINILPKEIDEFLNIKKIKPDLMAIWDRYDIIVNRGNYIEQEDQRMEVVESKEEPIEEEPIEEDPVTKEVKNIYKIKSKYFVMEMTNSYLAFNFLGTKGIVLSGFIREEIKKLEKRADYLMEKINTLSPSEQPQLIALYGELINILSELFSYHFMNNKTKINEILDVLRRIIPDISEPILDIPPDISQEFRIAAQNCINLFPTFEKSQENSKEMSVEYFEQIEVFGITKTLYDIYAIRNNLRNLQTGRAFKEVNDLIGYFFNNSKAPDNFKGNIYQSIKRVPIVLDFHEHVQDFLPNKTLSNIENLSSEFSDQYYDKMSKAIITEGFADGVQISQKKTLMLTVNHEIFLNKFNFLMEQYEWFIRNLPENIDTGNAIGFINITEPMKEFIEMIRRSGFQCVSLLENLQKTIEFNKTKSSAMVQEEISFTEQLNGLVDDKDSFLENFKNSNRINPQEIIELLDRIGNFVNQNIKSKSFKLPKYEVYNYIRKEYNIKFNPEFNKLLDSEKNWFNSAISTLENSDLSSFNNLQAIYYFLSNFTIAKKTDVAVTQLKIKGFLDSLNQISVGANIQETEEIVKNAFNELINLNDYDLTAIFSPEESVGNKASGMLKQFSQMSQEIKQKKSLLQSAKEAGKEAIKTIKKAIGLKKKEEKEEEKTKKLSIISKKQYGTLKPMIGPIVRGLAPFQKKSVSVIAQFFVEAEEKTKQLVTELRRNFLAKSENILQDISFLNRNLSSIKGGLNKKILLNKIQKPKTKKKKYIKKHKNTQKLKVVKNKKRKTKKYKKKIQRKKSRRH